MSSPIELNGQNFSLRYTVNSLCQLEEMTGMSLERLLKTGFSSVRGLLWCGLQYQMNHLTLEEAGNLLQQHLEKGGTLEKIAQAVCTALEDAGFFHPGEAGNPPPSP